MDSCANCLYCPNLPTRIVRGRFTSTLMFECKFDHNLKLWTGRSRMICEDWRPIQPYEKDLLALAEEEG